jgi:hypothetical protein
MIVSEKDPLANRLPLRNTEIFQTIKRNQRLMVGGDDGTCKKAEERNIKRKGGAETDRQEGVAPRRENANHQSEAGRGTGHQS